MTDGLVDRIYESAFIPETWPTVLSALADIGGARAGFLFTSRDESHRCTASSAAGAEAMAPLVATGWLWRSERFRRFTRIQHAGFVCDSVIYTDEQKETDPFYAELLHPRGLGAAAGTVIRLPTGDRLAISVERERARGPVAPEQIDVLDALRPHLARSALMATRLQLEHARTIGDTIGAVGLAALVIDDRGRVRAANDLVEALTGVIHWRARDRVAFADRVASSLLDDAVATIARDQDAASRSFPVVDPATGARLIAHVVPIRRSARDVFTLSAAVIVLTPVGLRDAAPVELVQSLFDFTPAEARVARGLAGGKTVNDLARAGGVSANTVRAQVRGILQKSGCARQSDVVALLTTMSAAIPQQS